MNLTPDLINRLTAIRSLLALGDLELVSAASVRLESFRSEDALAAVLNALASHRYSEADQMINAILTEGLRPATWTDAATFTTVTATSTANQMMISAPPIIGAAAGHVLGSIYLGLRQRSGRRGDVGQHGGIHEHTNGEPQHCAGSLGHSPPHRLVRPKPGVGGNQGMNAPTMLVVNEGPRLVDLDGTAACRIELITVENS